MTTDPLHADPADVAEQQQDVDRAPDDEEAPVRDPEGLSLEADEADVADQRTDVPGWDDEVDEG
jgi:hypothetical protein